MLSIHTDPRRLMLTGTMLSGAAAFGYLTATGHDRVPIAAALLICLGLFIAFAVRNLYLALMLAFMTLAVVSREPAPFDLISLALTPVALLRRRSQTKLPIWLLALLALFSLGQVASTVVSPFPSDSARWSMVSIYLAAMGLFAWAIARDLDLLAAALIGYIGGAVLSTAIGLVALSGLLDIPIVLKSGIRLQGFYKDPNVFGPYLVLAILILIAFPFEGMRIGRWIRRVRPVLLAILTTGVLFSYSRGAWANLILSLCGYACLRMLRSPKSIPKAIVVLAVLLSCVPLLASLLSLASNSYFATRFGLQPYDQARFAIRDRSIVEFPSQPIFGHGSGISVDVWGYDPHNVYTRLLYENGLVGFGVVTLLIGIATVIALRTALRSPRVVEQRLAAAFAAALVSVAAESFVIDTLHWRNLWFLVGWSWATGCWIRSGIRATPATGADVATAAAAESLHDRRGPQRADGRG